MGKVKIPYLVLKRGKVYWQPTKEMRAAGAKAVACGPDGPAAWARAAAAHDAWKTELVAPAIKTRAKGTLGADRRTPEWAGKEPRTREEWDRCWKRIDLAFGSCRPSDVTLVEISRFRVIIERNVSRREAHRCIKIWRALWKVAAALKYCKAGEDPSRGVRNLEPAPRQAVWTDGEVARRRALGAAATRV